jgi:HSP20 family protein
MNDRSQFQHWSEYAKAYLGEPFWNEIMNTIQPYATGFPFQTEAGSNRPSQTGPRIDLFRTSQDLIALIEVPGIENANSIELQIDGHTLSVSGYIRKKYPQDAAVMLERVTGHFARTISLPSPVRKDGVVARYAHGVLEVRMPVAGQDKSKKQKIRIDY